MLEPNLKVLAYEPWMVGVRSRNVPTKKTIGGDGETNTREKKS